MKNIVNIWLNTFFIQFIHFLRNEVILIKNISVKILNGRILQFGMYFIVTNLLVYKHLLFPKAKHLYKLTQSALNLILYYVLALFKIDNFSL